jgi:hypothetical protein
MKSNLLKLGESNLSLVLFLLNYSFIAFYMVYFHVFSLNFVSKAHAVDYLLNYKVEVDEFLKLFCLSSIHLLELINSLKTMRLFMVIKR